MEPIDEQSARLVVPFGDQEETFIVRFDPDTGMLRLMESMRYKGEDSDTKTLWINEILEWAEVDGHTLPVVVAPDLAGRGLTLWPKMG